SAAVGGVKRISRSCSENQHAAFFEMPQGPGADERLSLGGAVDGRHDPRRLAEVFQRHLKGYDVDYRAKHAHVVGGGLVDLAFSGQFCAADHVAAADDHCHLAADLGCLCNLVGNNRQFFGVNPKLAGFGETFPTDLEYHTTVTGHGRIGHESALLSNSPGELLGPQHTAATGELDRRVVAGSSRLCFTADN